MFGMTAFDPDRYASTAPPDMPEPVRRRLVAQHDRRIGELGSHINAAMAEVLLQLGEFLRLDGWFDHGAKTPEDWVVWRLGVTASDARHHVRVARRLNEVPKIAEAFGKGELSYWQVRAMIPVATQEIEDDLLNMARYSTASQLQRIIRAYKGCLDRIELEHANERHRYRSLSCFFDGDGFLVVRGHLDPEQGKVLVEALERAERSLRDELPKEGNDDEIPTSAQLAADALVEVAHEALAGMDSDKPKPRIPEVSVHVDVRSLIDGGGDRCEVADGPVLASETARRLSCDVEVQAIFESDGKVLDYGRRKRTVTPRLRRALEQRDVTCRWPGCDRKRFAQAHHVEHWTIHHGETKLPNLMLLCFHHHRLVHEGGYTIIGDPEGIVTFLRPDGTPIPHSPMKGDGDLEKLVRRHQQRQLQIDPGTCTTQWDGYAPNYADCVDALLQQGGMLEAPRRGSP
jgi:hypothetical protein